MDIFFVVLLMESIVFICIKFKYNLLESEYEINCKYSILLFYGVLLFDRDKIVY